MIVGQLKVSFQQEDHDGWYLCDGRSVVSFSETKTVDGNYAGKAYREKSQLDTIPDVGKPEGGLLLMNTLSGSLTARVINADENKMYITEDYMPQGTTDSYIDSLVHVLNYEDKPEILRHPLYRSREQDDPSTPGTAQYNLCTEAIPKHEGTGGGTSHGYRIVEESGRAFTHEPEVFAESDEAYARTGYPKTPIDITPTYRIFTNLFVYLGENIQPPPPPPP